MGLFKRFWNAVKQYEICMGFHNVTLKSPVCSRCGYNITRDLPKQKNRKRSKAFSGKGK